MKSLNCKMVLIGLVALVALVAVQARADFIFDEDFSSAAYSASAVGANGYAPPSGTTDGGEYLTTYQDGNPGYNQNGWMRVRTVIGTGQMKYYPPDSGSVAVDMRVFTGGAGDYTGNVIHEYRHNSNGNSTKLAEKYLYADQHTRTFTAADTIEYHMWAFTNPQSGSEAENGGVVISMPFNNPTLLLSSWSGVRGRLGIQYYNAAPTGTKGNRLAFIGFGGTTGLIGTAWVYGDQLPAAHWVEVKGVVDFSPLASSLSPTVSLYYRDFGTDLPATLPGPTDESTYAWQSGGITNTPLWVGDLPASYTLDALAIIMNQGATRATAIRRVAVYDPNYVVPEPSSLALFGLGLVGLLAYAWRKRK